MEKALALQNVGEAFFQKEHILRSVRGAFLEKALSLQNGREAFFEKEHILRSGGVVFFEKGEFQKKKQGRKMLRPYPTGECLGSLFVSRWTRAPEHVSFLDAHFRHSALRQRDNLLFEMGELFRACLCDEITILDTYRAHLWDHKFRLEGDHHARLQRIF